MYKNALAIALGLLVADAAIAQNTLSHSNNAQVVPTSQAPMPTGTFDLTQSGSFDITLQNSVSCNDGGIHTDNYYYRRFDLDTHFAATGTVTIASVDIGVEQAAAGSGGTQPLTLNLYAIPNASTLTVANLGAPIATQTVGVADGGLVLLNIPIAASLNGTTHDLVVEVYSPDGGTANHSFFIGSNATASINPAGAPSYLRAPDCSVTEPTPTSSIGFPTMNIVMVVHATTLPVGLQSFGVD
ncbi:MAG TPA: hypothetical protein PKO41_02155 [Dokdonella sp.]|uniref:hypothetical protein n=1 Tax=Dokdonella sp. TaxID=2291710 RepID=UPI0025BAD77B|nr:hypothetical protein [Dokdonella sp.]MBX3693504.1 hypothetical protein [Dokdonella sp.]HNR91205.1 hypothetical protein [Dokdonella sp.]